MSKFIKHSDWHRVGGGFSIQLSAEDPDHGVIRTLCTWDPRQPTEREMRRNVNQAKYQAAIHAFGRALLGDQE